MKVIKGKIKEAQRIVIYGVAGIGKSTLASKFPDPIFIDTEAGTSSLDVQRLEMPTSWTILKQQVQWAAKQNYKTIVIDTADWAEKLCINNICAERGIVSLGGNNDYGKSYNLLVDEWSKLLNYLTEIQKKGINIVLCGHAKQRRVDLPNEMDSFDKWELKMEKKTSDATKEWATMLLFVDYKLLVVENESGKNKATGGQRIVYTTYHPNWDAKVKDADLPEKFKLDDAYDILKPYVTGFDTEVKDVKDVKETKTEEKQVEVEVDEERAAIQAEAIKNKQLADLMALNDITEDVIRKVVFSHGFYPEETNINDYDEKFINGMLVAKWEQILPELKTAKGLK